MISGAVLAGSTNMAMFLVFRFFAGAGAFMILAAVPIWMAEVVPPYLRGALVQLHAIILVIGYMCASWLGFGVGAIHVLKLALYSDACRRSTTGRTAAMRPGASLLRSSASSHSACWLDSTGVQRAVSSHIRR